MDELRDLLEVEVPCGEANPATLGGFVMAQLGRVPRAGHRFVWQGFTIEVRAMAGLRVAKVRVQRT